MRHSGLRLLALLGFVVLVAGAGGWWMIRGSAEPPTATAPPSAKPPETAGAPVLPKADRDSLTLPGVIEPFEAVPVSSRLSANIAALYVRNGSQVKKGQLLCTLDDTQIRQQIEMARAALLEAQESLRKGEEKRTQEGPSRRLRLEKARTALDAAQRDLDTFKPDADLQLKQSRVARDRAEKELADYEQLYASKAVSLEDLRTKRRAAEDARLADDQQQQRLQNQREAKEHALRQAQLDYDQAKMESEREEISPQEIEARRLQVRNAQNELAIRQARLADIRIAAPISGTVRIIARTRTSSMTPGGESADVLGPGVTVYEGDPFLEIAATERACVRIEVDETDVGRLRIGLPAKITGDAFKGRELKGDVVIIQTSGRKAGEGVSLFPVTVLISSPLQGVRMGMTADVTIDLAAGDPMRHGGQS
jgi:HlyD family secretion protein